MSIWMRMGMMMVMIRCQYESSRKKMKVVDGSGLWSTDVKVVDGSGAGQRAKGAGRQLSLAHIRRIFLPFPRRDSLTFQSCLLIIPFPPWRSSPQPRSPPHLTRLSSWYSNGRQWQFSTTKKSGQKRGTGYWMCLQMVSNGTQISEITSWLTIYCFAFLNFSLFSPILFDYFFTPWTQTTNALSILDYQQK